MNTNMNISKLPRLITEARFNAITSEVVDDFIAQHEHLKQDRISSALLKKVYLTRTWSGHFNKEATVVAEQLAAFAVKLMFDLLASRSDSKEQVPDDVCQDLLEGLDTDFLARLYLKTESPRLRERILTRAESLCGYKEFIGAVYTATRKL